MKTLVNRLSLSIFVLLFAVGSSDLFAQGSPLALATLPDAPAPQVASSSSSLQTSSAPAQSADPAPPQGTAAQPQAPRRTSSEDQVKAEEKQRLLGIVPAFNLVNGDEAVPLTRGQKFHLWYRSSIDPFTFAIAGVDAGIEQAEDSYPGYHQGFVGFAKRYGASYADSVDGNFWGNAVLPSLLRQDPRYFRLGHGTFKGRLWYATLSTVRAKGDNGRWEPNYSNVGGNLIGGAISNLYYPASDRGVGLIFERGFTVTAEGAFGSLAYEFYPDAIAYLKRRQQRKADAAAARAAGSAPAPTAGTPTH